MASSFSTLKALVAINLGNRGDSDTTSVIEAAINYATLIAAIIFQPPELKTTGSVTITGGSSSVSISSLTNLLDVVKLYNTTDSKAMWYIPYDLWEAVVPGSVGAVKYFSQFGNTLYVKDTPSVNKSLLVSYSKYPTKLVNGTDVLDYDFHDSYIISLATSLSWGAFEESEASQHWLAVSKALSDPFTLGSIARQVVAGRAESLELAVTKLKNREG